MALKNFFLAESAEKISFKINQLTLRALREILTFTKLSALR